MSGPTLTMAPAVESTAPFHRSHSTPDLQLLTKPPPPTGTASLSHHRTLSCKSLPSLPAFDVPSFDLDSDFSSPFFATTKKAAVTITTKDKSVTLRTDAKPAFPARPEKLARRKSLIDRPRSWISSSKSAPNVRGVTVEEYRESRENNGVTVEAPDVMAEAKSAEKTRTVSASFADFARRSWIATSRSPSPIGRSQDGGSDGETQQPSESDGSPKPSGKFSRKRPLSTPDAEASQSTDSLSSTSRALNRASEYLTKMKQRPQTVFSKSTSSLSMFSANANHADSPSLNPSLALLSESSRTPRNSSQTAISSDSSADSTNASTAQAASETGSHTTADTAPVPHATSRDPLWIAFKDLDANFAKFTARHTTPLKMTVVRATLVPFLRRYAFENTIKESKSLSSEDVERRAAVLHKWWNALLEMLDGPSRRPGYPPAMYVGMTGSTPLQPIAGIDRPVVLEAVTMIMMRPEWRLNTPAFRPLVDRSPDERVRARSNTADSKAFGDSGSGSDFLEESAEHNVRTMFVNTLLTQMALVVERMSMRHAPLSVVNFSGKACAYAFFFVPGIADIMVRLWGLDRNVDLIRRMADVLGLPRRSKGESDDIVALFPPNMGPWGWSSVSAMSMKLRRPAKLGLQIAKIPWHGPWVSRWRGGDTDLFFIFCKYFFILADEFMPSELPLVEKARAPAFVLLLSQVLSNLDSTIHRQATFEAMMGPPLSDTLQGADAAITALPPLLPSNLLRGMDDNRLIILLKDFLSADESISGARHTFAESFASVLEASTKKTSRYDHNACYMLCDFLEQSLLAYESYYENSLSTPMDYVDWQFWFDVFKMILYSNNTMSEIRMLSFLFSAWDILAADPARKEDLCLNWLLTEPVFERFFNNWCPMVRAYYMRLLCWRMCRDPGSSNELDTKIFLLVSQRLKSVWSHYLWLKQKADNAGHLPPSTAPSLPQPGKRFMIIRTEVGVPQPGLFSSFDSTANSFGQGNQIGADYRGPVSGPGSPKEEKADNSSSAKKKWTLLGKVLSFTSAATITAANGGAIKPTYDEQFEQVRRDIAATRTIPKAPNQQLSGFEAPLPPPKQAANDAVSPNSDSASSTGSSPVYDAAQFVFRFTLHNVPWLSGPPPPVFQNRTLTRPRLPAPAQARVSAKFTSSGSRSGSPPPPAPGLPPPTRRFSGLMMTGLVSEAKNANPAESVPSEDDPSSRHSTASRFPSNESMSSNGRSTPSDNGDGMEWERGRQVIQPVEPKGEVAVTSKYAGRALAEWSMVVNECNSFVDRRRDEGVLGLREVEVPSLGVEGLRRMA